MKDSLFGIIIKENGNPTIEFNNNELNYCKYQQFDYLAK